MFYGLNKFIKNLLPKRLFYRALLIVAVPVIVIQLIITIVFFDSLWIKTNKGMTRTLVNEISTFIEAYGSEQANKQGLLDLFSIFLDLNIEFTNNEKLQNKDTERWFSPIDRTLRRELKSKFGLNEYWFDTTSYKELIDLRIKYEDGYFKFLVPKDRVASSSARIFALWITVPAIIMVIISLIFLKNQTRPISTLARAAERFGKGENIEESIPEVLPNNLRAPTTACPHCNNRNTPLRTTRNRHLFRIGTIPPVTKTRHPRALNQPSRQHRSWKPQQNPHPQPEASPALRQIEKMHRPCSRLEGWAHHQQSLWGTPE